MFGRILVTEESIGSVYFPSDEKIEKGNAKNDETASKVVAPMEANDAPADLGTAAACELKKRHYDEWHNSPRGCGRDGSGDKSGYR